MAACSDVIKKLTCITIECRKLDLTTNVFSSNFLKELSFRYKVRIHRSFPENKFVAIWGTLERCPVYQVLQGGAQSIKYSKTDLDSFIFCFFIEIK